MGESLAMVKVGGSLLELPGLGSKLAGWLGDFGRRRAVLLAGGGTVADCVRRADRIHRLDSRAAHHLAIEAMALNSRLLVQLVPGAGLAASLEECRRMLHGGQTPIVDPVAALARIGPAAEGPASWEVTSDSIAAQLAVAWGFAEVVLLKSQPPPAATWGELACLGYVDAWFPRLAQLLPRVSAVDFRGRA
jgi:aspartokinase-like uncharacterized kinase